MNIRLANINDFDKILNLYKSVLGEEYCVWDEEYPNLRNIEEDYNSDNLFVLEYNKDIIACISIVSENEMDEFLEWKFKDNASEIARLVVDKKFRGQKISIFMLKEIERILIKRGRKVIHLAVAIKNIPAITNYKKLSFTIVGIKNMYESTYYLCEKEISE